MQNCVRASNPGEMDYSSHPFNLNNLPRARGSLLDEITDEIDGVNIPWLYMGMLFATFCWHNEDHHLNSCNYMHKGAPKTWSGGTVGNRCLLLPFLKFCLLPRNPSVQVWDPGRIRQKVRSYCEGASTAALQRKARSSAPGVQNDSRASAPQCSL